MSISRRSFLSATSAGVGLLASGHWTFAGDDAADKRGPNPFLSDVNAPVREEITADDLKVIGKLPDDLDGMFVRNGPNPQFPPILNYHWFEGDGMMHGVRLRDGKASYRNRYVRTDAWKEENRAGKALYPSVLDPVDAASFLETFASGELPYPNRGNTAFVWHHGKLLVLWEGGVPHEISVPQLETVGKYNFGGKLQHAFTAHPKIDPKTGELMFFGYWPIAPFLQYSVADRDGKILSTTPIELPRSVMIHDMAITENYSLFIDAPAVMDFSAVVRGVPIVDYEPRFGARVGILPRHGAGDQVKWFEIETCFVFHVFNAYEEGDEVVLHACRFAEFPKFVDFKGATTAENFEERINAVPPVAYEWRFDMKTGAVREAAVDDVTCEFPRVNETLTGRKARFGYVMTSDNRSSAFLKYDFDRGTSERHNVGKKRFAGEGVFVPKDGAEMEDDGYLVSLVSQQDAETGELIVVDCRDFASPPLARIVIPQRIPFGFHGIWLPGDLLS